MDVVPYKEATDASRTDLKMLTEGTKQETGVNAGCRKRLKQTFDK
jgi:hypothetical protein